MLTVLITFVSAFIIAVLLLMAVGMRSRAETKQTLERLETLTSPSFGPLSEEPINLQRQETFSNIDFLNRLLQQMQLASKLRALLYQAGLNWRAGDLLLVCLAVMIFFTWLVWERTNALPLAFVLGAGMGCLPVVYVYRKRAKRFDNFEERLPEALDLMVNALRAGHSLASAMSLVAHEMQDPIGPEFRQCVDEQNFGLDLRVALLNVATRMPIPDVRTLVAAILIQRETGGNVVEILEKVAHVIRERFRLRRQIRVYTAQGRLTGWVLSLLPVILGIGLYLVNPKYMSILWQRPVGVKMLYGAVIMTLIGGAIIKKIISIRV